MLNENLFTRLEHSTFHPQHGEHQARWAGGEGLLHVLLWECVMFVPGADPGGRGAGAGAHPWDGKTRAEGTGSLVSRAERTEGTLVSLEWLFNTIQA